MQITLGQMLDSITPLITSGNLPMTDIEQMKVQCACRLLQVRIAHELTLKENKQSTPEEIVEDIALQVNLLFEELLP